MREQTENMQKNMMESLNTLKEMAHKNQQFFEESLKMAQQNRKQEQQQMMEMVKQMQEKNARIAQGILV